MITRPGLRAGRTVARAIALASIAIGAVSVSVASAAEPAPSVPSSPAATVDADGNTALGSPDLTAGQYIVQVEDGADLDDVVADVAADGVEITGTMEGAIDAFTAPLDAGAIAALRQREDVLRVQRDRVYEVTDVQDSPPWGLDRIDQRTLPLDTKFSHQYTGAGVDAYVVDSGIRTTHSEFTDRVGQGAFVNFGDGTGVTDCNGHGTHVAGTVGGTTWGVAKAVSIRPVKVVSCDRTTSDALVILGLNWVIEDHKRAQPAVLNISLGGPVSTVLDDAVKKVVEDGITVVVAAGNDSTISSCDQSPADVPQVITVAASTDTDARTDFSSFGSCIDLFAPGAAVRSAAHDSDTGSTLKTGTSMAAPHVTGAAALVLEEHPTYTPAQVWAAIDADTTKGAISGEREGEPDKLLHVTHFATAPSTPTGLTAAVAPAAGVGSGEVGLSWTAPENDGGEPVTDYVIESSGDGITWTTVNDGSSTATAFTVGGLTSFASYQFRVAAVNSRGTGERSDPVTATPTGPPSLPSELMVTVAPADGVGSGEVKLSWDPSPAYEAVTDYVIEWTPDGEIWTTVDDGLSTATTVIVGELTNGTSYGFRVAAVNGLGTSPWRSTVAAPAGLPAAPTGLSAGTGGSGQVNLAWAAPVDNGGSDITDYVIESSTDGQTWTAVDEGVSTATTHVVGGLTNGIGYSFRVAAVNAVGAGPWSPPAGAVPEAPAAPPTAPPTEFTAAVAPARGVGSGQVKLTWTAPPANGSALHDYRIERSTDGTTWTRIDDGVSLATAATVRGLANGTVYRFRVAALNAVGAGPWSVTIRAVPRWKPTMPTALRAAVAPARGVGSGQVKLTWSPPTSTRGSAISDYVIQRSANGQAWRTVRDGVSTTRTRLVSRLTNGTPYRFRVAAKNAVGVGSWSVAVRATPRAR
jgi:subtilisin family serine protease